MKIAVMQPYFLPHIDYFQLMASVDRFVVLDDVNFIKKGWINRNRMLMNGKVHTFTIPLRGVSQNIRICDIELVDELIWREKLLKTVKQAYSKAPCFEDVFRLMERIVNFPSKRLDEYLLNSLFEITATMQLDVNVVASSRSYGNASLKAQERILDICKREGATSYINAIGGTDLYDKSTFAQQGVALNFLKPCPLDYLQCNNMKIPGLSILDVLMYNDVKSVSRLLRPKDFE